MAKKEKKEMTCSPEGGFCFCKGLMAILIVVLVWVSQATWSKVVITIAAALILIGAGSCACKKNSQKTKKK